MGSVFGVKEGRRVLSVLPAASSANIEKLPAVQTLQFREVCFYGKTSADVAFFQVRQAGQLRIKHRRAQDED